MDHTPELPCHLKKPILDNKPLPQAPSQMEINEYSNSSSESGNDCAYGPVLPPHLKYKNTSILDDTDNELYGPALPPHLSKVSEQSTKNLSGKVSKTSKVDNSSVTNHEDNDYVLSEDEYGPSLPPHLQDSSVSVNPLPGSDNKNSNNGSTSKTIGPALPFDFKQTIFGNSSKDEPDDIYCPDLPPHLKRKLSHEATYETHPIIQSESTKDGSSNESEHSEDDEVYGPLPPAEAVDMDEYIESTIHQRTEAAQQRLKNKNNKAPTREDWMLTLPEDRPLFSGLGLQARQFSKSGKRDRGDTSVWTDTPADKERKAQRAAEGRKTSKHEPEAHANPRDERLQAMVAKYNEAKRAQPLIDTHQSSNKKAKKESLSVTGVGRERKPFSREEDLHVNKFDEAQKSSILKKARNLNDRFSSGKSSKFL